MQKKIINIQTYVRVLQKTLCVSARKIFHFEHRLRIIYITTGNLNRVNAFRRPGSSANGRGTFLRDSPNASPRTDVVQLAEKMKNQTQVTCTPFGRDSRGGSSLRSHAAETEPEKSLKKALAKVCFGRTAIGLLTNFEASTGEFPLSRRKSMPPGQTRLFFKIAANDQFAVQNVIVHGSVISV